MYINITIQTTSCERKKGTLSIDWMEKVTITYHEAKPPSLLKPKKELFYARLESCDTRNTPTPAPRSLSLSPPRSRILLRNRARRAQPEIPRSNRDDIRHFDPRRSHSPVPSIYPNTVSLDCSSHHPPPERTWLSLQDQALTDLNPNNAELLNFQHTL